MGVNWFGSKPTTKQPEPEPEPKKPARRRKGGIKSGLAGGAEIEARVTRLPKTPAHWGYRVGYLGIMLVSCLALYGVAFWVTGQAPDPWKSVAVGAVLWHLIVAVMMR